MTQDLLTRNKLWIAINALATESVRQSSCNAPCNVVVVEIFDSKAEFDVDALVA